MPPTDIIDIYPLSPMQQGMLFHTLYEPTASIYTGQWTCLLTGPLDEDAFAAAWSAVVERHEAMRTSFVWQGLPDPVQVVHAKAALPIATEDWRDRSPDQQAADLEAYLEADRERPFELARPPLQRVALLRVADDAYRLVWTFHHLLLDGWCQAVVLAELVGHYEAAAAGTPTAFGPAPQFRDYISWLARRDAQADEAYWRQALAGVTGATPLGIDRGEHAGGAAPGAKPDYAFTILSEADTAAVNRAAQQLRVTPYRLLEAAFAVVLHRYSGDDDVTYGLTVAGRPAELAGADEIVGMFINTVPARVHVDGDATVADWVRTLDGQAAARLPYEHAALTDVQSWSGVQAPARLFDVVLVPQYPTDFNSARIGPVEVGEARLLERTNYPLTLVSFPGAELAVAAAYDPGRFDGALVQQLLDHIGVVLRAMACDTAQPVASLRVLTEAEEHQLLHEWNSTAAPYPDQPLHVLFERQAARSPEAVAVVAGDQQVTYGALNARANQLAHCLRALGVGPDVPVGICTDRSPDMVVAILGVWKAGGAYVPLDALLYPPDRLVFMMDDSCAPVVVVQGQTGAALPGVDADVVRLDGGDIDAFPTTNPKVEADLDRLAYVLYTSGSTGMPKGVLVPHRGLANLAGTLDIIKADAHSRVLQFAPYSFDISVGDLILALTSGATLCLASLDSLVSSEALLEQLKTERITNIQIVPSILSTLPVDELPDLETVLVGAEICPAELVARWAAPGRRFLNVYGPTEATICASYFECTDADRPPPIGKPIPNGRVYVLDRRGRPTPVGVPGEIVIGGVGVAQGYLNRPELTEQAFVPDPFSPEPGARMYHSGDLGRWTPDGNLDFLGRVDDQVKVRGHRVELGEVEAVLSLHDDVRDCAVATRGQGADRRLVAYIVPGMRPPIPAELRAHLQRTLPEYMVPSAFLFLASLPRLPNAKVDRAALPDPDGGRVLSEELVAPRDQLEETLAAIWSEVLGVADVGVTDNFFELGGHSLSAAKLISMVEAGFGRSLPLVELFESPTIERMADALRAPEREGSDKPTYYAAGRDLDLAEEAVLEPGIRPRAQGGAARPLRHVFLTGATTFLGCFVLDELIRRSDATIACLVPSPSAREGMSRLADAMARVGLDLDRTRVEAVPGSLTKPYLGMEVDHFGRQVARSDAVFHLGEVTDFEFLPYTALRSTNVTGTVEALRLACEASAPFHLLSTLGVVPLPEIVSRGVCPEDEATTWDDLPSGYAQSKWVAERLAREAGRRGLPVAVYRVGEVMGHSATGALDPTSTTTRTVLSSIEMGQVLAVDLPFVATPVDFAAAALAHLMLDPSSPGRTFNLTDLSDERPPTPRQIGGWLQELGYPVKLVSPLRWRRTVTKRVASGEDELLLAAEALAGVTEPGAFAGRAAYFLKFVRDHRKWAKATFACDNAKAALEPAGIACPRLGPDLLAVYLEEAARQGLLHAVAAPAGAGVGR